MQTQILQASAGTTAPGTQPPTALAKVVIFPGWFFSPSRPAAWGVNRQASRHFVGK
jgi:hypothetical protein